MFGHEDDLEWELKKVTKERDTLLAENEKLKDKQALGIVSQFNEYSLEQVKEIGRLRTALEQIASGILPNGDHVEGSVYEFANEVLKRG